MSVIKTAFISYSWDDDDHKTWVLGLAERLVANGVAVNLDQWDVRPGDSLTHFMDVKLPNADFVLVVCTPRYVEKSNSRDGGVGYESQIITARIAGGIARSKFVPIIRRGEMKISTSNCAVPPHFDGIFAIDMRDDKKYNEKFEGLLRHLYDEPLVQRPPLGIAPHFDNSGSPVNPIRLASFDIEGWEIQSGVVRNELYPGTFHIPDDASRRNIQAGDLVKLMFEYRYKKKKGNEFGAGERMWVKILGLSGPYFVGSLNNSPICSKKYHDIYLGKKITFLPEHVISIY
jgi:hypothetical protein